MQIQNIKFGENTSCGLSAISAITGLTTDEVAGLIRQLRGTTRHIISGTTPMDLGAVFRHLGYRMFEPTSRGYSKPTLGRWIKDNQETLNQTDTIFLIGTSDHWLLIQGDKYVCALTGKVIGLDHPRIQKRAKVALVFHILKD